MPDTPGPPNRAASHLPLVDYSHGPAFARAPASDPPPAALALDFGTHVTRAAWIDPRAGRAEVLPNRDGDASTPSVVYFGPDEVVVGRRAVALAAVEEEYPNVVFGAKRRLAHPTALPVPGREVTAIAVAAELFRKLKADAERDVFRTEVARGVIAHPVGFGPAEQDALRSAATAAGFRDVALVEEPVAVALAYDRAAPDAGDHVLVCDLGAHACHFAVVSRTEDGTFRLALPARTLHAGGDDFDRRLYDHCDAVARAELGRPVDPKGGTDVAFLLACTRQKEILSDRPRSEFRAYLSDGVRFRHRLERGAFEELVRGPAEQAARMARVLLDDAAAHGCAVQTVLLVGGSARIPLVRRAFETALPVPVAGWPQGDAAVALGAAYFADRDRAAPDARVRVSSRTSLSELIHRVATREAAERSRMDADNQRERDARRVRVLDGFAARADADEAEHQRLRRALVQHVANREYALAQEAVSALRSVAPDDPELLKAQRLLDTQHAKIGDARAITVAGQVNALAVTPDGQFAVAGLGNKQLALCDLTAGTVAKTFAGHTDAITGVAVRPDGEQFASAGRDGTIRLWALDTANPAASLKDVIARGPAPAVAKPPAPLAYESVVQGVTYFPDGKQIAACGDDKRVKLWDVEKRAVVCTLEGNDSEALAVACSPDAALILCGTKAKAVRLWSVATGREVRAMSVLGGEVRCARFFPGGRLAVTAHSDGTLRVWDTQTGREMGRWEGHEGAVNGVAFTPDGRHAVSGGDDKTVRVWDVASGWAVRTFAGHGNAIRCVDVTPDGRFAVSGGSDNTVRVWGIGV